ncbi:endonuclease V [Pedobacter endophyticus]|uniref:Endonuclease V n=1 Tax=Pedobacter endophyticus TaxID=2789740 RepID=A0A7S9L1L8_9SPHI|nr:endonuclease V [Pedobacter endophyticus]QPH40847.1 endonuclease V [Pedobacter endophyticus]
MILALDVHYREQKAKSVGILFNWNDIEPQSIIVDYYEDIEEYIPGQFFKRELPCLLNVIKKIDLRTVEVIVIDGYVYVDNDYKFGLGGVLWEKLNEQISIIGIAKTSFFKNKETVIEIVRGASIKPLYISAIGMELKTAAELIKNMKGDFRMPSLLKQLDTITKE